jgi:ABC-2 type transport system permease protein
VSGPIAPRRPSARVQLAAIFRKEVGQTVRDRRVMFLLMVAPLIQTIVFGFAVDFDVDDVPTLVVDLDRSAESRAHTRALLADGTLRGVGDAPSMEDAQRAIDRGDAAVAVVLPRDFGADLLAGRPAEAQVVMDGSDPNRATVAGGAASRYFGEVGERLVRERLVARGLPPPVPVQLVPRLAYNPGLRTPPFMVPGIAAMLLVIVTTLTSAMGLAREREMGTLEQVLVTPIRPLLLLVGKMAPFVVIGFVDVLLLVGAGSWLFDIPIRGNPAVFLVGTVLYLMTTLGIGLLISTVSSNQQQAFLGGFLFAMPAIILSGIMTPVRAMPAWLQAVTLLNPLRWFGEVMRGVLLRGAGFGDLWRPLLALAVLGTTILLVASARFHKRLA